MQQRILGLDPGLAVLGFGVIDCQMPQSPTPLDFGAIKTSAKTEMGDRLRTIYDDLHSLIHQWQPDLVAIEKLFFYKMGNTIAIAQARGVIVLVLAQSGVPFVEFTPAEVKLALTGMGNADKYDVQQAVAQELNLDYIPKPDDAADALAIALTACYGQ